jgi:DNA-binding NarL/FixJ family response regulator
MSTDGAVVRRRVLIVDDHPIVRHGLRRMIEAAPDLVVCGEAETESGAREAIRLLRPDVVTVDLTLGHGDGLELVRDVAAHHPELPMLVLSMHEESIYAERLIAAGALGYIMKQAASDQLLVALRRVLAGQIYLSESLTRALRDRAEAPEVAGVADPLTRLSNRELQVLGKIGRGLSSREIAAELVLSVKTVESHRQSVKRKLNLATNAQLLQYAVNFVAASRGGA